MALLKLYFYSLTALLAVNVILADNSNETELQEKASLFPSNFNPLTFFSQFFPFSRQTRDVSSQENQETTTESSTETTSTAPNQRFFFQGGALVACNYTATPGLSCVGCNQALSCRPGNVGVQRRCLLYCNSGRCSLVPGSQCLNSTVAG